MTVMLTDVRMPRDKGWFTLAREVARRWPGVRLAIMSAERRPKPGYLPEGAVFIAKPFTPRMILGVVERVTRS